MLKSFTLSADGLFFFFFCRLFIFLLSLYTHSLLPGSPAVVYCFTNVRFESLVTAVRFLGKKNKF